MIQHRGTYPDNWPEISGRIKAQHNHCCERCGHPNDRLTGHVLTVHHLDGDKSNCEDWNLAALCQRCHLHIQGKVLMEQFFMFEHSAWMLPHVEGFYMSLQERFICRK